MVLSLVGGVKEHRLKLWLKAMEVVLCGYSQRKCLQLNKLLLFSVIVNPIVTFVMHIIVC